MGARIVAYAVLLVALVVSLTLAWPRPTPAVAAHPTGAPEGVQGRTTLRVGMLPVTAFLGLYVAREQGWFQEEGIELDVQIMAGGAEIVPAMIGGSLDLGIVNTFSHVLARDRGFDVRAVAAGGSEVRGAPTHAILVGPNSPIQTARDLEGRTFATNTLNNIDHLMVQIWLRNNGADPRRVNFVEIPFPQHPAAIVQGRVDAIGPTEPFVTVALSQGARLLAYHYTDTNPSTLIAYYSATGDWLSRNPGLARGFANAIHRANSYLEANPDEKRAAAVRHLNISPEVAARMNIETLETRIDPAGIQWWIDAGRQFNLVDRPLNPDDFLWETVR
jgi:NitT/TauT family transport system substrate-binding protein